MHRTTLALGTGVLAVSLALLPAAATAAPGKPGQPRYSAGEEGVGDPYFPLAGNGVIDVLHYDLDLTYTPPEPAPAPLTGELQGTATVTLRATEDLDRFNLDLRGLTASEVRVDGKPMRFEQSDNELVITPRPKLKAGRTAEVVVTYSGATGRPRDVGGALYGWVTTRDGAMVVNEPDGAPTWFPVNDHPTDKATYTFDVTVPEGLTAVANGLLVGETTTDGWTTWSWDAPDQMASYLATASVGNYELRQYTTSSGLPVIDALDADVPAENYADLALTEPMLEFFEDLYGPYPFVAYGAIVDDDSVGYALETQTRSIFSRRANEGTIAHELAHSWMGNAVSPASWQEIWLNEGWATYSEHLWSEHSGGTTAEEEFAQLMDIPASSSFWDTVIGDPGPVDMFAGAVYSRGAGALHALRQEVGDEDFFTIARQWYARHDDATATTEDLLELAEEVSGEDLDELFEVWLYVPEKPTDW